MPALVFAVQPGPLQFINTESISSNEALLSWKFPYYLYEFEYNLTYTCRWQTLCPVVSLKSFDYIRIFFVCGLLPASACQQCALTWSYWCCPFAILYPTSLAEIVLNVLHFVGTTCVWNWLTQPPVFSGRVVTLPPIFAVRYRYALGLQSKQISGGRNQEVRHYRLSDLHPNTMYTVFISSRVSFGSLWSRSQTITFTTGEDIPGETPVRHYGYQILGVRISVDVCAPNYVSYL